MKYALNFIVCIALIGTTVLISCRKETSCEGCKENNKPPISIAGPDQVITLPTDSVLLDGSSSSDPDGTISVWLWTKISGPASFKVDNPGDSITLIKTLTIGTYQFELKVSDNAGLSSKDTVQVTVNNAAPRNRPPIANAGSDQAITLPTNSLTVNGSGSTDPDSNIVSYSWTKISGPASFNIVNPFSVQTQVTILVEGVYQFELKVTDAGGLFSKDTMNLVVLDTSGLNNHDSYEIIVTLPIDSVFIDDYYRDSEGTCIAYLSGPASYSIQGQWIKQLVPGIYFFRRYWYNCVFAAEIIKITVLDDPNETNTITYRSLTWEYNCVYMNAGPNCHFSFLSRPMWPNNVNPSLEVKLQTDFLNNGQWFPLPSNIDGYAFSLDCGFSFNNCLFFFIVRVSPENSNWEGRKANLKIKIL